MPKLGYKQTDEHKQKHLSAIRGEANGRWGGGIWADDPNAYRKEARRKRKLIERNVEGFHSTAQWLELKKQYNSQCPSCLESEPEIVLTRDHIQPLTKGGTDEIENIQPLCFQCNRKKSAKFVRY